MHPREKLALYFLGSSAGNCSNCQFNVTQLSFYVCRAFSSETFMDFHIPMSFEILPRFAQHITMEPFANCVTTRRRRRRHRLSHNTSSLFFGYRIPNIFICICNKCHVITYSDMFVRKTNGKCLCYTIF